MPGFLANRYFLVLPFAGLPGAFSSSRQMAFVGIHPLPMALIPRWNGKEMIPQVGCRYNITTAYRLDPGQFERMKEGAARAGA